MGTTQSEPYLAHKIDYSLKITRELVEKHKGAWQAEKKELVSAILFGPLAVHEYDENIQLLEIVKGFPYPRPRNGVSVHEFESTRQFPMYGRLRLHIMSPQEFTEAVSANHPLIGEIRANRKFLFDHRDFAKKLLR